MKSHEESQSTGPLSYGQRALWFLQQLDPGSGAYNVKLAARITTGVDAVALRNAFQLLVDRHPALRTVFPASRSGPIQQVQEHQVVNFKEVDASAMNWEELRQRLAAESHEPFDLERGPLLRIHLFKSSTNEHDLLLTMHHIVVDFWSIAIMLSELSMLYADEETLPALESQYLDYANWQIEMLAGSEGERLWSYWRQQLAGELTMLNLPTDRPRKQVQTFRGAAHSFRLDSILTSKLKALLAGEARDMYSLLLAAFQVLLHTYTSQENIFVGVTPVGQRRAGFERVVGFFHNPVVLRADLSGNPTFKELLTQVHRTVQEALRHQEYPFSLLVERLQPARDPAVSPIFQVMFVLYKEEQRELPFLTGEVGSRINLGGLELELLDIEEQVSMLDLTLTMIEEGESFSASLQYNTDLFDGATIERMTENFQCLLETLAHNPHARIQELSETIRPARAGKSLARRRMDFSLFYFASAAQAPAQDSYKLLIEGAKFADQHGFSAVWTPERHFDSFGGPFPNPSITSAAIAAITDRIQIRAGSVVLPLHHPVRVAEEWAVVDNLSNGRVGISFASGWNTDDFLFAPENYAHREEVMRREIETVRRLWRGETVTFAGIGDRELRVRTLPRPIQRELPVWLTAAGPTETFRLVGELGAYVLTDLLGQSIEMLAEKIDVYRRSWREHSHGPEAGHVTVMLHNFIGEDEWMIDRLREIGVDEVACLIDFGVGFDSMMASLRYLEQLMRASNNSDVPDDVSFEEVFDRVATRQNLMSRRQPQKGTRRFLRQA